MNIVNIFNIVIFYSEIYELYSFNLLTLKDLYATQPNPDLQIHRDSILL